jgi:hypothetical protein
MERMSGIEQEKDGENVRDRAAEGWRECQG